VGVRVGVFSAVFVGDGPPGVFVAVLVGVSIATEVGVGVSGGGGADRYTELIDAS
jgi:hypothetical protein